MLLNNISIGIHIINGVCIVGSSQSNMQYSLTRIYWFYQQSCVQDLGWLDNFCCFKSQAYQNGTMCTKIKKYRNYFVWWVKLTNSLDMKHNPARQASPNVSDSIIFNFSQNILQGISSINLQRTNRMISELLTILNWFTCFKQ